MTSPQGRALLGIGGLVALAGLGWLLDAGATSNPRARRYEPPRAPLPLRYRGFLIEEDFAGRWQITGPGGFRYFPRGSLSAAKADVDAIAGTDPG